MSLPTIPPSHSSLHHTPPTITLFPQSQYPTHRNTPPHPTFPLHTLSHHHNIPPIAKPHHIPPFHLHTLSTITISHPSQHPTTSHLPTLPTITISHPSQLPTTSPNISPHPTSHYPRHTCITLLTLHNIDPTVPPSH